MLQILETQRRLEEARAREDELRAEREQKDAAADAARVRQAALSRPTGAGTLAANAKPAGQIIRRWLARWCAAGAIPTGRRAGDRPILADRAGRARWSRHAAAPWRSPNHSAVTACW